MSIKQACLKVTALQTYTKVESGMAAAFARKQMRKCIASWKGIFFASRDHSRSWSRQLHLFFIIICARPSSNSNTLSTALLAPCFFAVLDL